jgi:hypothetical protein
MMVAGVPVRNQDVLHMTGLMDDSGFHDTAEALVVALEADQALVPLTIEDREAIWRALDDPSEGLAELRGVLLAEHEGRVREGLV